MPDIGDSLISDLDHFLPVFSDHDHGNIIRVPDSYRSLRQAKSEHCVVYNASQQGSENRFLRDTPRDTVHPGTIVCLIRQGSVPGVVSDNGPDVLRDRQTL